MANAAYDNLKSDLPAGTIDWLTDNILAVLVNASYTFTATDADLAALGSSMLSGQTPQALNVTNVDATGFVWADSVVFSGVTTGQTAKAIILYVDRGGGVTELLWYFDSGTGFPLTTTGANVTVDWNATAANGIVFKVG